MANNTWAWELEGKKPPSIEVIMELLSAEYGWLPSEIKKESYADISNYLKIISEKRKLANQKYGQ